MKILSSLIAIFGFVMLCLAITFSVLYPQLSILNNSCWVITGVLLLAWLGTEYKSVSAFFTSKSTRYGANLGFVIFLVLGILVFLNILGKDYNWRKDLTKSGLNTLSPQTVKVLRELPVPIKALYFARSPEREKGEAVFKEYTYASNKIHYEVVDPDRQPTLAASVGVKKMNTVVLSTDGSPKQVKVDGVSEEKLTNGIIKLLKTKSETIYFTVGHGERELENTETGGSYGIIKGELEKEGYTVKVLNLLASGKVPEDAAILAIAGPQSAFFPKELEILSAWIKNGGHAFVAVDLDTRESSLSNGSLQIAALLKDYGVQPMTEMLVDPTSKQANVEPQVLMGFANNAHPITRDFPTSSLGLVANFLFPLTTYLRHSDVPGEEIVSLAKTSPSAWAESDWKGLKQGVAEYHEGKDFKGQMDLAVAVEKKLDKKDNKIRLAVFATSQFAINSVVKVAGNRDLFLNTMSWLGSEEQFISIRAAGEGDSEKVSADSNMINFVFLLTVFVIPFAIVVVGISVWRRRLKQ